MRQLGSLLNSSPACLLLCPWSSSSSSLFYGSSQIRSGRPLAELLRLGRGVARSCCSTRTGYPVTEACPHEFVFIGCLTERTHYTGRTSASAPLDCCLCRNHSHGTFRVGLGKQEREPQISPRLDEGVWLL